MQPYVEIQIMSDRERTVVMETSVEEFVSEADVFGNFLARGAEAFALRCGGGDDELIVATLDAVRQEFDEYVDGMVNCHERKVKARCRTPTA